MESIRITMLGPSGVGKTCFMVGMYGIMREGVKGFTFSSEDLDDDLLLSDWWDQIENGGEGRWPDNTTTSRDYNFYFSYAFRELMGFKWHDYRGGALRDGKDSEDLDLLMSQLAQSDAILLCVSGEHFRTDIAAEKKVLTVSRKAQIGRMNEILTRLNRDYFRQGDTLPVVIITITKGDECADRTPEELENIVKQLFNPLFAPGSEWLVMICRVSLGSSLASDQNDGELAPYNVHFPVSFAVYTKFKERAQEARDRAKKKQVEAENLGGTWFKEWWNQGEIQTLRDESDLQVELYAEIEKNINLLGEELIQDAMIYFGSQRIYLDGR